MSCELAGFRLLCQMHCSRVASLMLAAVLSLQFNVMLARGQTAVPFSGSVEGRITCGDGGFPARHARVSLASLDSLLPQREKLKLASFNSNTTADFDGYFAIPGVPPGDYLLDVRLPGYSDEAGLVLRVLKRFPPERQKELLGSLPQVMVRSGRVRKDVVLRRGAAISGRVSFDDGGGAAGRHHESHHG